MKSGKEIAGLFPIVYSSLYSGAIEVQQHEWDLLIEEFDQGPSRNDDEWQSVLREFYAEHGDCVASEREVVAFMLAYHSRWW